MPPAGQSKAKTKPKGKRPKKKVISFDFKLCPQYGLSSQCRDTQIDRGKEKRQTDEQAGR